MTETHTVFADPGFHIAVLGALLDQQALNQGQVEAALLGIVGDDEFARLDEAIARLHAMAAETSALAQIDRLGFDGGNEIYMLLEDGADVDTGGEDNTYAMRSLVGIGALTGLRILELDGHVGPDGPVDLRPLENHPALGICTVAGDCSGVAVLETIPTLKEFECSFGDVDDPSVLDRLASRGVIVRR
jgi:hypothetical protein